MALKLTEEDIAKRMMDLVAGCLREAINTALTEKYGSSWVKLYINDFNKDVENKNITRKAQQKKLINGMNENITSVRHFDFQACLKLLLYMYDKYGVVVLNKYGLLSSKDTFLTVVNKLIIFRNKFSHKDDPENNSVDKYTCEQAILHMKTLASYFPGIYDRKTGKTYISEIEQIYFDFTKRENTKAYRFADFKVFNGISDEKLTNVCAKLSIQTTYNLKKELVFFSYDVNNDVRRICINLENNTQTNKAPYSETFVPPVNSTYNKASNNKKKRKVIIAAIIAILLVIIIIIIAVLAGRASGNNENQNNATSEPASQSVADAASNFYSAASDIIEQHANENREESTTSSDSNSSDNNSENSQTDQIPQEYRKLFNASNSSWKEDISVGETNIPGFINGIDNVWSNVRGYSENTSIATVDDDLIVTGKSKGTVRILYVGEFQGHDETYIVEYTVN